MSTNTEAFQFIPDAQAIEMELRGLKTDPDAMLALATKLLAERDKQLEGWIQTYAARRIYQLRTLGNNATSNSGVANPTYNDFTPSTQLGDVSDPILKIMPGSKLVTRVSINGWYIEAGGTLGTVYIGYHIIDLTTGLPAVAGGVTYQDLELVRLLPNANGIALSMVGEDFATGLPPGQYAIKLRYSGSFTTTGFAVHTGHTIAVSCVESPA